MKFIFVLFCFIPWIVASVLPFRDVALMWILISPFVTGIAMFFAYQEGRWGG